MLVHLEALIPLTSGMQKKNAGRFFELGKQVGKGGKKAGGVITTCASAENRSDTNSQSLDGAFFCAKVQSLLSQLNKWGRAQKNRSGKAEKKHGQKPMPHCLFPGTTRLDP
jgi:hypothetical protein